MTISSTTVRNSYSGDGSTTTFSYTFKIFQDSDIQVIIRSANGTETTKTITTHYTVTGAGNSGGGSVIFTSGNIPTSTQTVVLRRNIPQTQSIDYIANDPFPAESHEEGLDRATMAIQQLQEEVTRSLKLSKTNTMTSTEFTVGASDRANKILAFDTNGELSVTQELGTNRGSWSAGVTFNGRDIVKDGSNNNVYLCNTTHTSTGTTPISSNVDVAKWDLIVDASAATNAANNASNHASNSSNFANAASNHASNASNHASNSSNFANNSSNSANSASTYLAGVAANASNSSNFANNSSNSANSAANHSSNASNFANNSSNSANASANHSANSSNFANNSSNSANSASASASTATTQAGYASSNAATATTQAGYATANATLALGYSSNSSNFANNASNFANTASNAANAANSARDAALAAADNFDDTYLGAKASDPTLDNDGAALNAGDLYFNTTSSVLKYYTGSAWLNVEATDTSNFATKGFALAVSIAL
jgi:trimeric autotransporter adhesin